MAFALVLAAACSGKVDSSAEPPDAGGRSGSPSGGTSAGRGGSAGSAAGRGGAGADAGSGGRGGVGGATGGIGGTAGAAGAAGGRAPFDCFPEREDDACTRCTFTECCQEVGNCAFDTACLGEASCVLRCVRERVVDGGVPDELTIGACASQCADGSTIASATNDLLACIYNGVRSDGGSGTDCLIECSGVD